MCALKETLISYSHGTKIAENQTQNFMLWLAELHASWTPNLLRYLLLKWGHWLEWEFQQKLEWEYGGRPWWSWGHWPLNYDVSSLPMEVTSQPTLEETSLQPAKVTSPFPGVVAFPPLPQRIDPALLEEIGIASSEAVVMKDMLILLLRTHAHHPSLLLGL